MACFTGAQIRAQFQLPDDLTEEEKLEPVRNFGDDPKIRLLNRLYDKKRKARARCLWRAIAEDARCGTSALALFTSYDPSALQLVGIKHLGE